MFSMYPDTSTPTMGTQCAQWQLLEVDTVRDRQHKFHPYGATTGYKTEPSLPSACEYRFSRHQDHKPLGKQFHQPLSFQKQERQCHYQYQTPNNIGLSYFPTEYSYPTLNFLLHGNAENFKHDHQSSLFMYEPYGQQSLKGKQKRIDNLHPFYRRQLLTTVPSRDGLTRTRDKYRVVYTEKQKTLLKEEYQTNNFLPESRRANLAKETELSERQIKFWFQNRRAKDKRERKTKKASEVKTKIPKVSAQDMKSPKRKRDELETITSEINTSDSMSCNYAPLATCNGTPTSSNHKEQNQGTQKMEHFSSPSTEQLRYYDQDQDLGNQPISPTTGSCMFENPTGFSVDLSPSPTGCQFQYPISPSDWTSANHSAFYNKRFELSPLLTGLHYGLGYRV